VPPASGVKSKTHQQQAKNWAYSLTLKREALYTSETLITLYQTIWHHILGDITVHSHRFENLGPV
jgi:hypothetical protein